MVWQRWLIWIPGAWVMSMLMQYKSQSFVADLIIIQFQSLFGELWLLAISLWFVAVLYDQVSPAFK